MWLLIAEVLFTLRATTAISTQDNTRAPRLLREVTPEGAVRNVGSKGDGWYFLHIPKTAGESFWEDVLNITSHSKLDLTTTEGCYSDGLSQNRKVMTMLREPRALVLSQYMHCTTSRDHAYASQLMPATFQLWVESWKEIRQQKSTKRFCCYDPVDSQSYRFVCQPQTHDKTHAFNREIPEVDVIAARRSMQSAEFVGLTEAYQTSICLLHAKLFQKLPDYCNCEDNEASSHAPFHHYSHGSSKHKPTDYPEEVWKIVDELTAADRLLYMEAVRRFQQEVAQVEKLFGHKVLCQDLNSIGLSMFSEDDFPDLDAPGSEQPEAFLNGQRGCE